MSFLPSLTEQGLHPDLMDEPIDKTDEYLAYIGFLKNGDTTKCMIKRVWRQGTETTIMFANGYAEYDYNWNLRASLNYAHRKN